MILEKSMMQSITQSSREFPQKINKKNDPRKTDRSKTPTKKKIEIEKTLNKQIEKEIHELETLSKF